MINQYKWDLRFLDLAYQVSKWSKDPSLGVGAVIVNDLGQVVGTGYNGFPKGVKDLEERLTDRETKLRFIVHAELNAIITAGHRSFGSTIYTTFPTCSECSKSIIQSGIQRVVSNKLVGGIRAEMWKESLKVSKIMFEEAGVEVIEVE